MAIITQIQGGLGNQLFQYATGRALAEQYRSDLILDIDWYQNTYQDVTPRSFELSKFAIKASVADSYPRVPRLSRLRKTLQSLLPLQPFILQEKKHYTFDGCVNQLSLFKDQHLYLRGYWQSYKYFEKIQNLLRLELTPNQGLDSAYGSYFDQISRAGSTMLHVRRGDYIHLAAASKVHQVVDINYYQAAMQKAFSMQENIQFFVFSDDLPWAKANLPFQEKLTFIEGAQTHDDVIQELSLMRACQNHIIANSSLSWWGAWLKDREDGFVIAPSRWINDASAGVNDLLPPQWLRL
jgi:Glycosyl transferase family 11